MLKASIESTLPTAFLATHLADGECAPSFGELLELAAVDGVNPRIIIVEETTSRTIEACAICTTYDGRFHGITLRQYILFGLFLHDYLRLYARTPEALQVLLTAAKEDARRLKCDLLNLSSIIAEALPPGHSLALEREKKIFDSTKSDWKTLYQRKSVKRFYKDLSRLGKLHVEIIDGSVPRIMMEQMAALHRVRWHFAGSTSAFDNPLRIREYLCHPTNKHYLRLCLNGEVVASHYGMRYGKTLLWHTPLINPKYLHYSPLRLLLAETAKYCEKNGCQSLDFGLGDEAYKDDYCDSYRTTATFQSPLTLKGQLSLTIAWLLKRGVLTIFVHVKQGLRWLKHHTRHTQKVVYYIRHTSANTAALPDGIQFSKITTWPDFYDFMVAHHQPVEQWQYERFLHHNQMYFVALHNAHEVLCSGWTFSGDRFYIGESKTWIHLHQQCLLFDFVTPIEHRCKGHYTTLLKALQQMTTDSLKEQLIYARETNIASRKAIERAGFRENKCLLK